MRYINPSEAIKRLAAAQGIDVLNLVKTEEEMAQEKQEQMQLQQQQTLLNQAGQLASSPMLDPSKNEGASELIEQQAQASNEEPIPQEQPPT